MHQALWMAPKPHTLSHSGHTGKHTVTHMFTHTQSEASTQTLNPFSKTQTCVFRENLKTLLPQYI